MGQLLSRFCFYDNFIYLGCDVLRQCPAVLSTPEIPFALLHSQKRLESPGAAPGPGLPFHGGVFLCRSRLASFSLP